MARRRASAPRGRSAMGLVPALTALGLLFAMALAGALESTLRAPLGADRSPLWERALEDPRLVDALVFSVAMAVVATLLSALLAVRLAAAVRHRPRRELAVGVPVVVPPLLLATTAALWLAPGGLADRLVGGLPVDVVRDRWGIGIVVVSVWKEAPFLALLVLSAWDDGVARRSEAAATLGADGRARWRHVVWPAIRTPLALGSLVSGAFVLGSFEVPLVVGPTQPPMLAPLALQQTRVASLDGQGVAAATLLLTTGLTLLPALAASRWARRADV